MKNTLLVLLFSVAAILLKAQTIHVVMVIDQVTNIAPTCEVDRVGMEQLLRNVAAETRMSVKPYSVSSFTPAATLQTLRSISCGSNDVLFFYYTGHGYRYGNQSDQFPYMAFKVTSSQVSSSEMLSLGEVATVLKGKGARLNLILGDLCNSVIPLSEPVHMNVEEGSMTAYKKLFLSSRGTVISASSKPGETSGCNTTMGGFWTRSFLDVLADYYEAGKAVDWNTLLTEARNKTASRTSNRQNPVFTADVTVATSVAASVE